MALVLADRVRDTTTTTGTGTVTLSGTAVVGYQTFGAGVGNGNETYYTIAGQGTTEWEVGIGTYSSTGPTLTRTTVLSSSNGGARVSFSAGTKDVFVTYPAGKSVNYDSSGNVGIGTTAPSCALDVVRSAANSVVNITSGSNTLQLFENTAGDASLINYASGKSITVSQAGAGFINFGTNNTERVRIDSSGKVGIGTTTPAEALDVKGTIRSGVDVSAYVKVGRYNSTFGGAAIDTAGSATFLSLQAEGVEGLQIAAVTGTLLSIPTYNNTATGSTVVITSTGAIRRTSSSIKYKKDVEDLDLSLATNAVDRLRPVYYRTKNPEGDDKAEWSHIGLIAEEVHEVEPRLVRYRTAAIVEGEDGNRVERELEVPEPEDVDYARLSVLLLAEIKQLRARVAALEAK